MKIILSLLKAFLNFIYFFMKLKKTNKNKITFLSRQQNDISLDMKLIKEELLKNNKNLEMVFLCKRFDNIKKHFISYGFYNLKIMHHISTSHVVITDSYSLPVSVLHHKKDLKVMQIWHALGAIKKFGYQTVGKTSGRKSVIANTLCMHKNYDAIISGSKASTKFFMEAFNYKENVFLNYGLPRIDYLINNHTKLKCEILNKYKGLKSKINILYAPTFRTTKDFEINDLIKEIDFSKYNLILKCHKNQIVAVKNNNIYTCSAFSALELLSVCDYLITDYSAIAIEASILNIKTFYYCYDYQKYIENNGLNIDLYKEMPGVVFSNAKDLMKKLDSNNYDINLVLNYKNKYIDIQNGISTKLIANKILKWIKE